MVRDATFNQLNNLFIFCHSMAKYAKKDDAFDKMHLVN